MINLPKWNLTLCPPLYDTASKSPIEMTAQVYGKMRELVEEYNKFSSELEKAFEDYTYNTTSNMEEFKNNITCIMQSYIESVDSKLSEYKALLYNEENEEIIVGG